MNLKTNKKFIYLLSPSNIKNNKFFVVLVEVLSTKKISFDEFVNDVNFNCSRDEALRISKKNSATIDF